MSKTPISQENLALHQERLKKLDKLFQHMPGLLGAKFDARDWSEVVLHIHVKNGIVDMIEFKDSTTIK